MPGQQSWRECCPLCLLRRQLSNRIDGVICLFTPFIFVRERYVGNGATLPNDISSLLWLYVGADGRLGI
jgi:hypothetical protein